MTGKGKEIFYKKIRRTFFSIDKSLVGWSD